MSNRPVGEPFEGADTRVVVVTPVDKLGNVISGSAGGGASGGAAASYLSPGNFTAAWASPTTLALTELPFPPLQEQIIQVAEYDGDTLVGVYSQSDPALDFTWAPGADSSTGTLTIAGAVMTTGNDLVVQISGPQPDSLDVTTDFGGPYTHQSPRDFDVVFATATTLTVGGVTPMAMDPDQADIRAVVEIAAGGAIRMTYTRREWAMTWAAGGAGAGVLTIVGATMQNGSAFIVFVEGPEHGLARADAGPSVATPVRYNQPVDEQGNVIGGGGGVASGLTLFSTMASHFTAAWVDATHLDLAGGFPTVDSYVQFVEIEAWDATGGYIGKYTPKTHAFSWDAVNDRVAVVGALFVTGGEVKVSILGPDRTQDRPQDSVKTLTGNHFELTSDDALNVVLTTAQDFTAAWVDLLPEFSLFGKRRLKVWLVIDINDSVDLRFRLLEKHESGGTEEYTPSIETYGTADVQFEPGYRELAVDADTLTCLVFDLDGCTPFGQLQIMAGTLGAGTDAQVDGAGITRSAFGG